MKVKAKLNNLRISARKVRLVADMIRGKSAERSRGILKFTIKKAAEPILKLLNSALANAENIKKSKIDANNFYVSKIEINDGPKYKRMRPRARGQGYEIQKKTSHIILELDEKMAEIKTVKTKIKHKHES